MGTPINIGRSTSLRQHYRTIRPIMEVKSSESPEGLLYARSADIYLDDFNEPSVALEYYKQAMDYGYKESACLEGIARCYMVLGDYNMAYTYYKQCEDSGYFSITMSINYAFLLIQRCESAKALSCLESAYAQSKSQEVRDNMQKYIVYTRSIVKNGYIPEDPDKRYSEFIDRTLPLLRSLDKPCLRPYMDARSKGCAVIVELREHPWLEHALRNAALFLPEEWSILMVHGSANKSYVDRIMNAWRVEGLIGMHNLQINNLNRGTYSNLLKSPEFWNLIPTHRTLIFQTDAMLLGRGLEKFYEWDFIGAPLNDFHVPEGVGNGGFSLRTVPVMKEIAARFCASSPADEMEDVFFARMLHLHGAEFHPPAQLATRQAAFSFCAEWRLRDMPVAESPLAIHQAWRFHDCDQVNKWFDQAESAYKYLRC